MSTLVIRLLQKYWRLTRGLTLVAEACLVDAEDRVMLVAAGGRPDLWTLPHVTVRRGESLADALRRALPTHLALEPASKPELLAIRPVSAPDGRGQIATYLIRRWRSEASVRASAPAVTFAATDELPPSLDAETKLRLLNALDRRPPREM